MGLNVKELMLESVRPEECVQESLIARRDDVHTRGMAVVNG